MRSNVPMRLQPLSSLFDTFFSDHLPEVFPGSHAPATNIAETEDALELSFELPGLSEEDIHLDVHNRLLTVSAERKREEKTEGKTWHRREQQAGKWARTLQLPDSVDTSKVEATYEAGILRVTVQKLPQSKPVRVQINKG